MVNCNKYFCTRQRFCFCWNGNILLFEHRCLSCENKMSLNGCLYAVSGNFLHILNLFFCDGLSVSFPQRTCNWMCSECFCHGCPFQQLSFCCTVCRILSRNGECALCQSTSFVKCNRIDICESLQVVAAFDENTVFRCTANAAKEGEGDRDDQCTRTRDNQECQCTGNPFQPNCTV